MGPAGPSLLTAETTEAIGRISTCVLRTRRHPAAAAVPDAPSFDALYERSATFAEVYGAIVEELVTLARGAGEVLYLVPGSPMVAEDTVPLLQARAAAGDIEVVVLSALSFLDLAWARLAVDPLAAGVRVVDGHRFAVEAAGDRGPLLVAQCHSRAVLSDIKLSIDTDVTGPGPRVVVLQRLGLPDEHVESVAWDDIDRSIEPDHLTSIYIESMKAPVAGQVVRLEELMRTLRAGCPWDAQQTPASLARYAIEEAYELAEAVARLEAPGHAGSGDEGSGDEGWGDAGDAIDDYVGELGDVLFQVVFHACIGAERGWFTLADVARTVHDKLVHRHPHVFPRETFDASGVASAGDVVTNWEQIKAAERGDDPTRPDPMAGLPGSAPALVFAAKVLKRAEAAGQPFAAAGALDSGDDLGVALLGLVVECRSRGVDAEESLRLAAANLRDAVRSAATPI